MVNVQKRSGFTLVEMMVVVVIIGLLSVIAIPKYMDYTTKTKIAEIPPIMAAYEHAQLVFLSERASLGTIAEIIFEAPTSKWFSYTDGAAGAGNLKVTVAPGVTIGKFGPGSSCQTTVSSTGVVTRSAGDFGTRYLPNFEP